MQHTHCADDDGDDDTQCEEYFGDYVPETVDPGLTLLFATVIFFVIVLSLVCVLVFMGNSADAKKRKQLEEAEASKEEKENIAERVEVHHALVVTTGARRDVVVIDEREDGRSIMSEESLNFGSSFQSQSLRAGRHRRRRMRATKMLESLLKDDELTKCDDNDKDNDGKQDEDGNVKDNSNKQDTSSSTSSATGTSDASSESEEYKMDGTLYDIFLDVAEWDHEMKRLFQLGVPFALQALCSGLLEIVTTAVVGRLLGTRELSAFVVSAMCVELTAGILGGVHDSLTTLCSQAIGARNNFLAGQYVQLSVLIYLLIAFPFAVIWWIYMVPVMLWFEFDEKTAIIAGNYARILIFDLFILENIGEAIHGLLDVCGREKYSTIIGVVEEVLALVGIYVLARYGQPSLTDIAYLELGLGIIFLVFNIIYIWYKGWFRKYYKGMLGSFAFYNTKAVWLMTKTGASLIFGLLLTEAEWEILAVFASFMGPAEIAAWGVLGSIWGSVEELIESIGDAAEVRAAFLLGSGQYEKAKASAYKSILVSMYVAFFLTSGLYAFGDDLPSWITDDPTLQYLLRDMLPLIGLGFIALTMGGVCWTLIGAQGRYHQATLFVIFGSVLLTMPLACIFSVVLNFNLQGQAMAIIVGYISSGSANTYLLFRTDWSQASKRVIEENREADDSSSSSSESSGSSSISSKPSSRSRSRSSKSSSISIYRSSSKSSSSSSSSSNSSSNSIRAAIENITIAEPSSDSQLDTATDERVSDLTSATQADTVANQPIDGPFLQLYTLKSQLNTEPPSAPQPDSATSQLITEPPSDPQPHTATNQLIVQPPPDPLLGTATNQLNIEPSPAPQPDIATSQLNIEPPPDPQPDTATKQNLAPPLLSESDIATKQCVEPPSVSEPDTATKTATDIATRRLICNLVL